MLTSGLSLEHREDAKEEAENGSAGNQGDEEAEAALDEISKKYNLDDYDDEGGGVLGVGDDVVFPNNDDDPYITVRDDEDNEDLDDLTIRTTDALLLAGTAEEDYSHLDMHVYEEPDDNLYVHHDIMLPTYPLCIAWSDSLPLSQRGGKGNFVAIGTFDPAIELWDLDVVDALQPTAVLGGLAQEEAPRPPSKSRKQRQRKKPQLRAGSHAGAVLSLSFNRHQAHVLASCSEDKTIKLWDVGRAECLQTYGYHRDKVQTVRWHQNESSVLASGAFDRQLCILDVRHHAPATSWNLSADVESLEWNPHNSNQLLVSTEDGVVSCYSLEAGAQPLWTLQAHSKSVSAIACNPSIPNMLATVSTDKTFKIWDLASAPTPHCLSTTEAPLGKLFCGAFYEDSPFLLAVGGKKGLKVYKTSEVDAVRQRFGSSSSETTA